MSSSMHTDGEHSRSSRISAARRRGSHSPTETDRSHYRREVITPSPAPACAHVQITEPSLQRDRVHHDLSQVRVEVRDTRQGVGYERLEGGPGARGLKPYGTSASSLARATARVRPSTPSLE
jgi:hypothetical protein